MSFEDNLFDIPDHNYEFSPRFVHFHETVNFLVSKKLTEFKPSITTNSSKNKKPKKTDIKCDILAGYLTEAFDLFYQLNYLRSKEKFNKKDEQYKALKNEYLPSYELDADKVGKNDEIIISMAHIHSMRNVRKNKLKIGLANIKVYHENIKESYLKNPIITTKRREEINQLLNQVTEEGYDKKVDILVFPETSIPYRWLKWISNFSRVHELAIVFGMEHIVVNDIAYNFNVTLLPIEVNTFENHGAKRKIKSVIPIIRLKNHYAPGEIKVLKGYRYNIPIPSPQRYDLINWKGVNFAIFNCFELTDILHRSLFRSKVDFLIACEFNRDTNYFSNIVDAVTRDVHCYFIQSNNSDFGDNRITKPSKTAAKDIIKIKGGENSTILVSTIDIKSLREFQFKEHELQMEDPSFKLTPPGFEIREQHRKTPKKK